MGQSIFIADGDRFVPTEHARGPWDPGALHGGAPAALITSALELADPRPDLQVARLGFEFLRPVPCVPLTLTTRLVRDGRRVQELAAELHAGEQPVCRAAALRVRMVPEDLPASAAGADAPPMPGPESGRLHRFALNDADTASFAASAMEMRWLDDPGLLGPARVWMRLRHPLIDDRPASPLARLVATADFGNGISASLEFARYLFVNADLGVHLHRPPQGDWIGMDSRTLLHPGGSGLAESVIHDVHGPVARGFQSLVVEAR